MKDCARLKTCGFFIKYQKSKELVCRGFIDMYCKGEMQQSCQRLAYIEEHGHPPGDDMMPSGQIIPGSDD